MTARFYFAWYDVWVGAYWDRARSILYVCPIPRILHDAPPRDAVSPSLWGAP